MGGTASDRIDGIIRKKRRRRLEQKHLGNFFWTRLHAAKFLLYKGAAAAGGIGGF
jgi:hypothetical protein